MLSLASCCLFVCTRAHVHRYKKPVHNLRGKTNPHRKRYAIIRKLHDIACETGPCTSQHSWLNTQNTRPSCVKRAHLATLMVEHANHATIVCKTSSPGNAHGRTRKSRDHRV